MKKKLSVFILVCSSICALLNAFAELYDDGLYTYIDNGDGTACITDINWDYVTGDIIVPDSIDGLVVTSIDSYAFMPDDTSKPVSIILPKTLTSIGEFAFRETRIVSIIIPQSVNKIGEGAFSYCTELSSINVDPNNPIFASVDGALYNKSERKLVAYVEDAVVPNGIVEIGASACAGLDIKAENVLVESIRQIDESAFSDARIHVSRLMKTGDYNKYTGDINFYYNYECRLMNNAVEQIGTDAFAWAHIYTGNENYSNVTITLFPDVCKSIEYGAFRGCSFSLGAGKNSHNTILFGEQLKDVSEWAFSELHITTGFGEICVPEHLGFVGGGAFSDGEFTLSTQSKKPMQVDEVGGFAFSGVSFNVPLTIGNMDTYAFDSSVIPMVTILDGVNTIPEYAFYGATINQINIPNTLSSIDEYAFSHVQSLTRIDLSNTKISTISEGVFCDSFISQISLPDTLISIDTNAFSNCSHLKAIEIPSSVITIGESAFENSNVESVVLQSGLTTIGANAFNSCQMLQVLYIPNTVSTIGLEAFERNTIELRVDASSYAEQWALNNGIPYNYQGGTDLSWLGYEEIQNTTEGNEEAVYVAPDFWNDPDSCIRWLRDRPFDELREYFEYCENAGVDFGDIIDYVYNFYDRDEKAIAQAFGMLNMNVSDKSYLMFWTDNRSISVMHCSSDKIAKQMADEYSYDQSLKYACGKTLVTICDYNKR